MGRLGNIYREWGGVQGEQRVTARATDALRITGFHLTVRLTSCRVKLQDRDLFKIIWFYLTLYKKWSLRIGTPLSAVDALCKRMCECNCHHLQHPPEGRATLYTTSEPFSSKGNLLESLSKDLSRLLVFPTHLCFFFLGCQFGREPDTFKCMRHISVRAIWSVRLFDTHIVRAIWSVRSKRSHGCVALKNSLMIL